MELVKKERMLSNFDLVDTSVVSAAIVQHTVEYELPTTSLLVPFLRTGDIGEYYSDDEDSGVMAGSPLNSEDEVQTLLDPPTSTKSAPISWTYSVQSLPDISTTCPRETPAEVAYPPRSIQDYHAAQELMFVYTTVDPFAPTEPGGITNSLSMHGLHLDDLQYPVEDQHPDDFRRWMLQAQIRQAAAERDRLTIIINELLTVYSHGKRNTEVVSTPLRGLRTHTYVVVMFHEHARLIRVDWSGTVVSEAFNFCTRLDDGTISPLEVFLRGFNAMSIEERGWDGTVTLVHPSSKLGKKAMDMLAPWVWGRRSFDEGEKSRSTGADKATVSRPPLLLFEVPDAARDGELEDSQPFVVWYPINGRKSRDLHELCAEVTVDDLKWSLSSYAPLYVWDDLCIPSRNTLVYPAFDPVNGTVGILKDSWRLYETSRDLGESEVLRSMNHANVDNVPELVCGQDVAHLKVSEGEFDDQRFHITRTQDHVGQRWNTLTRDRTVGGSPTTDPEFCVRIHHRLVEKDICSPSKELKGLENSEEFMARVFHAMIGMHPLSYFTLIVLNDGTAIGHHEAFALCGVLHRDISLDNIMVNPLGGGILCDWDRAQQVVPADESFEHQPAVVRTTAVPDKQAVLT
jgi:Fungal protein kinase